MKILFLIFLLTISCFQVSSQNYSAYDLEEAKMICDNLPLHPIEGIWEYPEDNVIVLILHNDSGRSKELRQYSITVVESEDCRLNPGDEIGILEATPEVATYKIELFTEKKDKLLLKPSSCIAKLSKDEDSLIIKKGKSKFRLRLNLNFSKLLPNFWKIVSAGVNQNSSSSQPEAAVGMVKVYPSYDGNGSSRRRPRYL